MKVEQSAAKRAVVEKLLEQGMVLATLDARREGVRVPDHFVKDPQLRLNLSYRFGLPMDLNDEGVVATLTFSGVPFSCFLPWASIYMVVSHVSGQPFLFPSDIPDEAASDLAEVHNPIADVPSKPTLRLINGESTEEAHDPTPTGDAPEGPPDDTPEPPEGPSRGHLRVVK